MCILKSGLCRLKDIVNTQEKPKKFNEVKQKNMNSPKNTSKTLTKPDVDILQIIDKARDAERRQDIDASREIFRSVWTDLEKDPEFGEVDTLTNARLLRYSGSFLSRYGHAKGLENYQERGKNLIFRAISSFEEENTIHEACEAKVYLASAYFFEGRIDEAEIILDEAASHYDSNQLHPIYLLTQINRITAFHWKQDFQSAVKILNDIKIPMDLCDDASLLAQYHNQAGLILARIERFDEALDHYEQAIKNGYEVDRERGVGISLNNLAYLNSSKGNNTEANRNVLEALRIFDELGDQGWVAIVLDTKAQVHLREDKLESAMESIEKAIDLFQMGERYSALTDALWVKISILLRRDKKEEAFSLFAELTDIASREIGEYAVKKYTKEMSKVIYSIKELGYHDEVRSFKRQILRDSLVNSGLDTKKAAKKLKINEDNLLRILNKQFSGIYDEFGIKYTSAFA